jgi:antitoxin component YwqK of YwqJK toxin-antitoxin module
MEERYYMDGEKVKSWSKYDKNGKLIIVVQFKNGKEYKINGVKVNLNREDD